MLLCIWLLLSSALSPNSGTKAAIGEPVQPLFGRKILSSPGTTSDESNTVLGVTSSSMAAQLVGDGLMGRDESPSTLTSSSVTAANPTAILTATARTLLSTTFTSSKSIIKHPAPANNLSSNAALNSLTAPTGTSLLIKIGNLTLNTSSAITATAADSAQQFSSSEGARPLDMVPKIHSGNGIELDLQKALYLRNTMRAFWWCGWDWTNGTTLVDTTMQDAFSSGYRRTDESITLLEKIMADADIPLHNCNQGHQVYNFPISDKDDLMRQALANTGIAIGATLDLVERTTSSNPGIALELASMATIEGRQNTYFRQQNGLPILDAHDRESRLPIDWALTWAHQCIGDNVTCPLPGGLQPPTRLDFDVLNKTPAIQIGVSVTFQWHPIPNTPSIDNLQVLWLDQLWSPTYSSAFQTTTDILTNRTTLNTRVPGNLSGVAFAAIAPRKTVNNFTDLARQTLIAGPAIVQIT